MQIDPKLLNDPRARRWGNAIKILFLLGAGFLVAPFVWTALGGLLGLIAGAGICLGAWMIRPWVFSAAANMRLKLIKAEARRNPVETLEENLRSETVKLDERKTNIEKLSAQIRNFEGKVDEIANRYGKQDGGYIKLSRQLTDLQRIYTNRCEKWREAHQKLDRFAEEIDRAKMIWEAACAADAARETSGLTEDEFFTKLRTEMAFDSIQTSYNEALASLDTAMLEEPTSTLTTEQQPALPPPLNTIDEIPSRTNTKVREPRQ